MDHLLFDYDRVRRLNPCVDGFRDAVERLGGASAWMGRPLSIRQLANAGTPLNDLIWLTAAAATGDADIERRVRLCCTDWAAHVAANRNVVPSHLVTALGKLTVAAAALTVPKAIDLARAVAIGTVSAKDGDRVLSMLRPSHRLRWTAGGEAQWAAWAALRVAVYPAGYESSTGRSWESSFAPFLVANAGRFSAVSLDLDSEAAEAAWQLDRLCAWMNPDEPDLISLA